MGASLETASGWSWGTEERARASRHQGFGSRENFQDSPAAAFSVEGYASRLKASLYSRLSTSQKIEFASLAREKDPEMFLAGTLAFGERLEDAGQVEQAAEIYSTLLAPHPHPLPVGERGSLSAPSLNGPFPSPRRGEGQGEGSLGAIQLRARQRLDALTGRGHSGLRTEFLLKRFTESATDYRTIVPMMAGSLFGLGVRAAVVARMGAARNAGLGLTLAFRPSVLGNVSEVLVFALTGHLLQGGNIPFSQQLTSSAFSLGALKLSGWGLRNVPHPLIRQAGIFGGLLAAQHLEVAWGLRPRLDAATTLTDTLGSLISLQVGGHLAHRLSGPGFRRFQAEVGWREKNLPMAPTFPSLPWDTVPLGRRGGPISLPVARPEISSPMAMIGLKDPSGLSSPENGGGGDLKNSLHLLFANYAGLSAARSEVIQHWPELKERIDRGLLSFADWEVLRGMFHVVAHRGDRNMEKWFLAVSRWFGSTDHRVRTVPFPADWQSEGADPLSGIGPVDNLKYSTLVYAYSLAAREFPFSEGLRRYLGLTPEFRTHFTDLMLVMDQAIQSVLSLRPEDVTPALQSRLQETTLRNFLELSFIDLKDLLFEHDTLPSLINNTITNILFGSSQSINLYRVHINMTTINEKDGTNFHGNVFLETVRSWFQEKFGRIHVIQNPERTTFEFIAPSTRQVREAMSDFAPEIKSRIATTYGVDPEIVGHFLPKALISGRQIHRRNLYDYAIRSYADIDMFRRVVEFNGRLDVEELKTGTLKDARHIWRKLRPDIEGIVESGDPLLIRTLHALIIKATLELNGYLAAQTTFFEKEQAELKEKRNGRSNGRADSQAVYTQEEIPRAGHGAYEKWQGYLKRKAGYVGPGQYDPGYHRQDLREAGTGGPEFLKLGAEPDPTLRYQDDPKLPEGVNHLLRIIPRLGHIKGNLSHLREGSEGGLLQRFSTQMLRLSDATEAEVPQRLATWQATAWQLRNAFLHFYSLAITDPRNAWTAKQHREFLIHRGNVLERVASNFFLQEVALAQNTFLAAMEYDSFKAFNDKHGKQDDIDVDYNRVRDAIFLAAHRMNMAMPIVNPSGGDHISISFSEFDREGNPIEAVDYCHLVQQIVRETFSDRPYQDLHKVEMREMKIHLKVSSTSLPFSLEFLEEMRRSMKLDALPQFLPSGADSGTLLIPLKDRNHQDIGSKKIFAYLRERGIEARLTAESTQIHRLPIWKRIGGDEMEADYWLFSREAAAGYEPFVRTLTVSMALGHHAPLKEPADFSHLLEVEDKLGIRLGTIKEGKWPHKEGFGIFQNRKAQK